MSKIVFKYYSGGNGLLNDPFIERLTITEDRVSFVHETPNYNISNSIESDDLAEKRPSKYSWRFTPPKETTKRVLEQITHILITLIANYEEMSVCDGDYMEIKIFKPRLSLKFGFCWCGFEGLDKQIGELFRQIVPNDIIFPKFLYPYEETEILIDGK